MSLTESQVLLLNGYITVSGATAPISALKDLTKNQALVTVISNFNYYGFMPSLDALSKLLSLSKDELAKLWPPIEATMKEVTADNRQMDDFVVYQNFPREVLEMSDVEYWGKQILMYWGFDKEFFVEKRADRPEIPEKTQLRVLHLADETTLPKLYRNFLANKARWTQPQLAQVQFLLTHLNIQDFEMGQVSFRENGIQIVNHLLDNNLATKTCISDATDVLRLAALRSEADVSLRQPIKFKSFSRQERRLMCQLLENSKNLESDLAERPGLWKRLLQRLHPGDFKNPLLSAAYSKLYQGQLKSFASQAEAGISSANKAVLSLLQQRPGDFARRLHKLFAVFGTEAITSFTKVMDRLSTYQIIKLLKYLETITDRKTLAYPPKGNWSRLQIVENQKRHFPVEDLAALYLQAHLIINARLTKLAPAGFDVDPKVKLIKLQTNDQELASYGRGTVFELPKDVDFIRTASYWDNPGRTVWFDNGWNFFDASWKFLGATCWNQLSFPLEHDSYGGYGNYKNKTKADLTKAGAIFSGDPVSGQTGGKGCQLIDLYPEKLVKLGVRYAVWNILCFSKIAFEDAEEVIASLQWGEDAQSGKLFEPSRAQMNFPLKGKSLTKYVAYVDLEKRQLIYLDGNLKGDVSGAGNNGQRLSEQMPAFLEYLESLPSVADLFVYAKKGDIPVLYSDKDREIKGNIPAYVFKPENDANQFKQMDLGKLLS